VRASRRPARLRQQRDPKASETCPAHTIPLIIEAFAELGFPDGVVNVVTNALEDAGEVVGALIDAPQVRRINFTGSTASARSSPGARQSISSRACSSSAARRH
jgi:acyl-CoA reductase-like NAD-dependent aldehyde dehydrogenase